MRLIFPLSLGVKGRPVWNWNMPDICHPPITLSVKLLLASPKGIFQIGLITIIGLSAKNAILVIEFAKERFDNGATLVDAALHAVRQRLRPILMTSIAFGLGVLPLALNKGAGSGSQNAIGTGIVGGAVTTTLLGLFFVPLYFVTVLRLFKVKPLHAPPRSASKQTEEPKTEDAPPEEELVNV